MTGTAAEISPVSEIGSYNFQVGDMTKLLMEEYAKETMPVAGTDVERKRA